MNKSHLASVALALATSLAGCAGGVGTDGNADPASLSGWSVIQANRQAAYNAYLAANKDDYLSFKNAPLGTLGIPMVMFRLFPIIFPDIWGQPSDNFASVGFAADSLEPGRVLPLGLGHIGSTPAIPVPTPAGTINVNVHVVQLTCAGCHAGTVTKSDGTKMQMIGAPNTMFTSFRQAIGRTVNDPRYTAANFLAALNAQPLGWVYGDPALAQQEALERAIFNAPATATSPSGADQMLGQLKAGANFGAQRWIATLGTYTYQVPNAPDPSAPTPGYLDAIGFGITIITDPTKMTPAELKAALPPAPAMIDIMSTFMQKNRLAAQWDGAIISQLHRNLGAEFGVVQDPAHLNMDNANRTTRFTQNLPAPPYPFNVDLTAAARGAKLYQSYCASCHDSGGAQIFPTATVGSDANRANLWTPFSVAGLQQVLRAACTDPVTCNNPDGTPIPDNELARATGGYMALPLDGIWARAPYLHNGSVPTLKALLTNQRPTTFYRGNTTYDTKNVGFSWTSAQSPVATIYDTTRSGNSNTGHSSLQFNGINWDQHETQLEDLLEYLKTL